MQLRAFISYSNQDRLVASKVKEFLAEYNIEGFLAHEDINVSEEWRGRIIEELNQARVFVPLLSAAFKQSEWASQEMGFALAKNALIIPLSIDGTAPFGFVAAVQGRRIPSNPDYYPLLIDPIISNLPHEIFPVLIEKLSHAGNFRNAEALMRPLVPFFAAFNNTEIESFVDACIGNGQIWDAADCKTIYIPQFIQMHRAKIHAEKLEELTHLIKR